MNQDLSEILAQWPYDPTRVNVRLIQSSEGEPLIQIRLDLGILQLRYDGRPDGQTVHGFPSLLEYFEARADGTEPPPDEEEDQADASQEAGKSGRKAERGGRSAGGPSAAARPERPVGPESGGEFEDEDDGDGDVADHPDEAEAPREGPHGGEGEDDQLVLTPDDCRALRDEAAQYYHRYVALLILEDFEGVVRDTTRNLRVLDLCGRYAEAEEDRDTLEQFRAYIMMMRARALASQALRDNEPKAAVVAIDEGIEALRKYYADQGEPEAFATSNEAQALQEMRDGLVPKLPTSPPSQAAELRQRLQHAIDQENYELAAILRDELRLVQERGNEPRA